jgi:lysophospholipase L1-like esterase
MPLGDSITQGVLGSTDDTGFRRALYQSLTAAGYSVNFVGTQAHGIPTDFDRDHEGHSGWRADQIRDSISSWLTRNPADVILLHIGTNDISQGQTVSSTVSEVNQILDRIDARSTATVVFLARIINRNDGYSAATTTYNAQLQVLADTRVAAGDLIIVIDQEAALSYPSDLADAVHPNDSGYAKMAQCWFIPLSDYLGTVPIQLSTFTAACLNQGEVRLVWTTLTETNNYGFEVQKSMSAVDGYRTLPNSFVAGAGTTLAPHFYSYTDTTAGSGTWSYRLSQIDLDGMVHHTDGILVDGLTGVEERVLQEFSLLQNYPNPFNATTKIQFTIVDRQLTIIKVYDLMGREVATVVNEVKEPGTHTVQFDGSGLASGVYLYRLTAQQVNGGQAGAFVQTRRLLLLR